MRNDWKVTPLETDKIIPNLNLKTGEENIFTLVVDESNFVLYENGQEIYKMPQDSNITSAGEIYLGFFLPDRKNNYAKLEIDRIIISEIPKPDACQR
jgi:hypothetical protein